MRVEGPVRQPWLGLPEGALKPAEVFQTPTAPAGAPVADAPSPDQLGDAMDEAVMV
jgi:hypothetical protein